MLGCRSGQSTRTIRPDDSIYCGIGSNTGQLGFEFQFYGDHTVSISVPMMKRPWGKRHKHHSSEELCGQIWAHASEIHSKVEEGEYYWNDYDHTIIINMDGHPKKYIMTKRAKSKEPPESLKVLTGFMTGTVEW